MDKKIGIGDVPDDVLWVWALQMSRHYIVGVDMYKRIEETKKRYPEWFDKDVMVLKTRTKAVEFAAQKMIEKGFNLESWEQMGISREEFFAIKLRRGGIGATAVRNKLFREAMGLEKREETDREKYLRWMKEANTEAEFKKAVQGDWEGIEDREILEAFVDSVRIMGSDGVPSGLSEYQRQEFLYAMEMREKGYEMIRSRRRSGDKITFAKIKEEMEKVKNKPALIRVVYGKMMNGRSWTRRYEQMWKRSIGRVLLVNLASMPLGSRDMQYYLDDMHKNGVMIHSGNYGEDDKPQIQFIENPPVYRNRVREDREFFAMRKAKSKKWITKEGFRRLINRLKRKTKKNSGRHNLYYEEIQSGPITWGI